MSFWKILKVRKSMLLELKEKNLHIQHLKARLLIYEKRDEDIRELTRENEELRRELTNKNNVVLKLQEDKINYLQNERDFEETNEKLETENETLKDIIKGSKTISTARKEADKLKEVN